MAETAITQGGMSPAVEPSKMRPKSQNTKPMNALIIPINMALWKISAQRLSRFSRFIMPPMSFLQTTGTSHMPTKEWGGYTHIEMLMGTHQIQDKRMVVGGSIAYHGVFRNGQSYSWIPLQMALQIPLLKQAEQKHAPVLGGSIGYAIATNKNYGGGITAGVDVGWWYSISPDKSLSLSLSAKCLQTEIQLTEQLNGTDYQNRVGCTLMNIGLKLGIQL